MEASRETLMEQWSAKRYLYTLGQAIFGGEPSQEMLASADGELIGEAAAIMGLEDACGVTAALDAVAGDVEGARALYVRLFVGPGELRAKPWESTYLTKSKALFSRETLEVRNAYRAQGFLPAQYPRVADDHIALECGFLAVLSGRAVEALGAEDDEAYAAAAAAVEAFLDEHLLRWVDDYASDLEAAAPGSLFACMARLASEMAHRR